jgi:hypothetical protein
MSNIGEINFRAYEVLVAIARLDALERRLAAGMRTTKSVEFGYCSGASAQAVIFASRALGEAYFETIGLVQRSKQYLLNAKSQFETADLAAAEFFFALHNFGRIAMNAGMSHGD